MSNWSKERDFERDKRTWTPNDGSDGNSGCSGATGPLGKNCRCRRCRKTWGSSGGCSGMNCCSRQGATGATGPAGATGPCCPGATGATGPGGPAGAAGAAGASGATGPRGPAGAAGAAGATGSSGATGSAGATGASGASGTSGPAGATGPQGATGVIGCSEEEDIIDCEKDCVLIQRHDSSDPEKCTTLCIPISKFLALVQACGDEPGDCETSWGYDSKESTCFLDIPDLPANRWGWSNGPYVAADFSGDGVTLELWRSAAQCDLDKGEHVGDVTIKATLLPNVCSFAIAMLENFCLCDEVRVLIGNTQTQINSHGNKTVAPGSFPCAADVHEEKCDSLTFECALQVLPSGSLTDIYVLLHADVKKLI